MSIKNLDKKKKDGTQSKQGEGGGAPPKYKNEEDLVKAITEYFGECDTKKEPPSKAGLRVKLEISRETYGEYKKRFPYTIKKADDLIEKAWVNRLAGPNSTGAIFYLKNAFKEDYKDRQVHVGGDKDDSPINVSIEKKLKKVYGRT